MEEKERVALLFCQAKGEHSRLALQELCVPLLGELGEVISSGVCDKDQGSNSLHPFFCKVSKGWCC